MPFRPRTFSPVVSLPSIPLRYSEFDRTRQGPHPPCPFSALPPQGSLNEAAPQCISGRTSYHRTRLAFHSYPQLIQAFFNRPWFGPPSGFTRTSTWPWIDRPASGLQHATCRPFRLGFPTAPNLIVLNLATNHNSTAHFPRGTPSPHIEAPIACRHAVSGLFHSPPGVLFTFPSRYFCSIGRWTCLALDRGRPCFRRNCTCSALLGIGSQGEFSFSPTGLSPSAARLPSTVRLKKTFLTPRGVCGLLQNRPTTPCPQRPQAWHEHGLGYPPFAHHYLGDLFDFFFLRLLRCFTSPSARLI